ncbi:MAG: cupredoxin domain-containing protein [Actinomycetota bacterium]
MKRVIGAIGFAALLAAPISSHAATTPDIAIVGFLYLPSGHFSADPFDPGGAGTIALPVEPATFQQGQTIKIMNFDAALLAPHTLIEISGPARTSFSVTVQPGATASLRLPSVGGTYIYKCMIHQGMRGSFTIA